MQLSDITCLIVGASGTIGRTTAENFYREGARLALTYHTQKKSVLSNGLPASDLRIAAFKLDMRKWKDMQAVVARIKRKFGPINVLVNRAGVIGPIGATHEVSVEHWLHTMEINLIGSFNLVRAVVPLMLAAAGGKIIHFSGGGAAYGPPFFTAYGASRLLWCDSQRVRRLSSRTRTSR